MTSSSQLYPKKVQWRRSLSDITTAEDIFSSKKGSRKKSRVRATESHLSEAGYDFLSKPLSPELLAEFAIIYKDYMAQKSSGKVHPIVKSLTENQAKGKKYEILGLYHESKMVGGLIYRIDANLLGAAYKAFPDIRDLKIPIGIAYVVEKIFIARALDLGVEFVSQGVDTNGYGYYHLNIGLALFKLSFGYKPFVYTKGLDEPFSSLDDIDPPKKDALFILGNKPKNELAKAMIYSTVDIDETEKKYPVIMKNLDVEIRRI